MRIGLVTPFNPAAFPDRLGPDVPQLHRGATAVHILAEELLAQGHELTVFTSYPGAGPVREWKDLRTEDGTSPLQGSLRVIAVPRSGSLPLPGKRLAVARRLRKVLAPEIGNLDVLHAQWTYDYALAAGAFAKRIPTFCSVRDWAPLQLQMQTRSPASRLSPRSNALTASQEIALPACARRAIFVFPLFFGRRCGIIAPKRTKDEEDKGAYG